MLKLKKIKDPLYLSTITLLIISGFIVYFKFLPQNQAKKSLFDPDQTIDQIEINYQNEKTTLTKKDDSWQLNNDQKADQIKVDNLLEALQKLNLEEVVSENPENQTNYGVTNDQAIHLKVFCRENQLIDLLIGYAAPSFSQDYLRKPDEDKVYLSNTALRALIVQPTWEEKTEEASTSANQSGETL